VKFLLGRDYPGINIGPEPTTDRFVVVESGLAERRTPGNTLVVQPSKPYQARDVPPKFGWRGWRGSWCGIQGCDRN
jgi:hypothetical protein